MKILISPTEQNNTKTKLLLFLLLLLLLFWTYFKKQKQQVNDTEFRTHDDDSQIDEDDDIESKELQSKNKNIPLIVFILVFFLFVAPLIFWIGNNLKKPTSTTIYKDNGNKNELSNKKHADFPDEIRITIILPSNKKGFFQSYRFKNRRLKIWYIPEADEDKLKLYTRDSYVTILMTEKSFDKKTELKELNNLAKLSPTAQFYCIMTNNENMQEDKNLRDKEGKSFDTKSIKEANWILPEESNLKELPSFIKTYLIEKGIINE